MTRPILVVDDDPHIREVICFALGKAGHVTQVAGDGEGALALVGEADPRPVVLDVGLPGIDGLEVCRRIRRTSEVPILFLSSRDEEIDRVGTTAARVARRRPQPPILALTPNLDTSRRLSLLWGAHSVHTEDVDSYEEMTAKAAHYAQAEGFAKPTDLVLATAGIPFHTPGNTNNIRLIQI